MRLLEILKMEEKKHLLSHQLVKTTKSKKKKQKNKTPKTKSLMSKRNDDAEE